VTTSDCGDPAHCPVPGPADIDMRRVRTVAVPAGQRFYAAYRKSSWPEIFNSGFGETRFAPIYDASGVAIPTLYGGATRTVSLLESVFHEVHAGGARVISTAVDLAGRGLVELHGKDPARFIDLSDTALAHLGLGAQAADARTHLVAAGPGHYPCTRWWAERLHARGNVGGHLPVGLRWQSRIAELAAGDAVLLGDLLTADTASVFILFGDRVSVDLGDYAIGEHYADLAANGAGGLVAAVANQLGATIL